LPGKTRIMLKLNGAARQLDVAPWTSLLDALREYLAMSVQLSSRPAGDCRPVAAV
jgi:xanthine dehydrogenase YagT iron-sulfur-binding subunit